MPMWTPRTLSARTGVAIRRPGTNQRDTWDLSGADIGRRTVGVEVPRRGDLRHGALDGEVATGLHLHAALAVDLHLHAADLQLAVLAGDVELAVHRGDQR